MTPSEKLPAPTIRLRFRPWRFDDLSLAIALWGDPRVTAMIGGPFTNAKVRERLEAEIALQRDHGVQYWPLFLRDGDTHVGCCGLRPYAPQRGVFEIGFHLRPEHWGKGLATEAARSVIAYAFGPLNALGLFAGHHPDNSVSSKTLERLGLRYTHDELYPPTGRNHPSYLLTREEYQAAAAQP